MFKKTKEYLFIMLFFIGLVTHAQHDPKSWVFGINTANRFSELTDVGGGLQVGYASNCYTTYIGDISFIPYKGKVIPELATTVNLILFNFDTFMVTAGMGLAVDAVSLSKKEEEDAFFAFSNNNTHLAAKIKLRGVFNMSTWWKFITEINMNSLGGQFTTFSVGVNYELALRNQ